MRALITAGITIVFMTLWGGAVPALAAFPGQNGLIAFHTDRDGNDEIYVMNPDGSGQVNLTNHPTDDKQAQWSADGTRIVFRRGNDDADREIWVMNADGSDQEQLTFNDTEDEEPSWSPDGTKILFTADRHGIKQLYVMNADGSGQMRLIDDEGAAYREPQWSPDGTLIAYRRNPGGSETREIWVMNADGTNQRQLTDNDAEDEEPAWSPDGARIVFETDRDDGVTKELYVMNADGSSPMPLTMQGGNVPAWSPDGSRIVFRSDRDGNLEIYAMNADGSDQVRLTNSGTEDEAPSWQPLVSATTTTMSTGSTTTTTFPGQLLAGKKLLLKDDSENLDKRRLKLLIKDRAISLGGGNESADDPTMHGGALHVVSRSGDGFRAIYDLPAERWAYKGKPGKNKGYKLKNAGPIKTILIKAGKLVKAIGKGADLGHSLAGDPEPVHVALTIGTQTYCATFGGRTSYAPGKKYLAKKAEGPEACAALVPECGDGVLEPDEQCPLLEGAPELPALDATQDLDTGEGVSDDEVGLGEGDVEIARTQIEIAFVQDATVAGVNAVLESLGGRIVSMLEGVLILTVRIPDPGTLTALDAIIEQLEGDTLVRFAKRTYFGVPDLLPGNYSPSSADLPRIDHLLAVGAHAAWNASGALGTDPLARPLVVVADYFGSGPPGSPFDVVDVDSDYGTGSLNRHGYHVLGIIAATFGGSFSSDDLATGIYPVTANVRAVDSVIDATTRRTNSERDNLIIQRVRDAPGPVVVNTSLGFGCITPFWDTLLCNAVWAELEAVTWIEKVRGTANVAQAGAGLESKFIHADSAGNVASSVGAIDTRVNDAWAAASLLPGLETLTLGGVVTVPNLTNTLAVENLRVGGAAPFVPTCLSAGSKRSGHLAAVGTNVWSTVLPAGLGFDLGGTSMASPQVAGLSALVWSLRPTLTPQDVIAVLQATSTDPVLDLSGAANCAVDVSARVIDAYAAVLAADRDLTDAPVRSAILDIVDDAGALGGNGRFDERDIERFLIEFEVAGGTLDYSRFDLNGDGSTGGDDEGRVDLDIGQPATWGTVPRPDGVGVSFDENAVSDVEVLCYYAYSSLYVGSDQERTNLLADGTCATLNLVVDFPGMIEPGMPETLTATVGEDTPTGSVPRQDVYIELFPLGGTVIPPSGLTDAQGQFNTQVDLGDASGAVEVVVRALTAPGGTILAEETVRSTALCTDAPVQVELDVGNGEANPEVDGPVLRSGTEYRVTVEGTVSIWTSEWQSGVCKGAPAAGVGGPTGLDAHYWFAIPVGSTLCGGGFTCCPNHTSKFQMSLDGGGGFDHVDPPDDSYRASHRYDHLVTGEGQPSAFRWEESSSRGDDYGVFEVTVACASDTTTTTTTSTTTTTTTSTTTTTTTSTSMTTMQPSTTMVGTTTTTTTTLPGGGVFYRQYGSTGPVGPTVDVSDELRTESVMLGSASLLLAPVSYAGSPVPQADAHLACWTDTGASFTGSASVTNLFGVQTIDVGNPASACVPVDGTLAPTNAYTCYAATGSSAQTNAFLADTFVAESADVTAPIAVCLPAEIDGSVVVAPLSYLVCYATTTTASPVGTVAVSTAIGAGDFDVGLPAGVCLPSIVQSITPGP